MSQTLVTINNKNLVLSNLEKVYFPETGFVKAQVLDYYQKISSVLLPHVRGRPLTMKRYPEGANREYFYEKRVPKHAPAWMHVERISSSSEPFYSCVLDDLAALIWVINLASIEVHIPLYTLEDASRPTVMVFDLDPGLPAGLAECISMALEMREIMNLLGLQSFPKTSGGKGLHFYVPLNTSVSFEETKSFARAIARIMERKYPERALSKSTKGLRRGKVFIDWSQNDEHKTTVSVYSLRAQQRPLVSTPVLWEELEHAQKTCNTQALSFDANAVLARVRESGDLFAKVLEVRQKLPSIESLRV